MSVDEECAFAQRALYRAAGTDKTYLYQLEAKQSCLVNHFAFSVLVIKTKTCNPVRLQKLLSDTKTEDLFQNQTLITIATKSSCEMASPSEDHFERVKSHLKFS